MGETRHKGRGWALHWALHVRDGDETDVHWRLPCDGRAWRTTSWRTFHRTIYIIRSMLSLVEVRDDALRQPAKAVETACEGACEGACECECECVETARKSRRDDGESGRRGVGYGDRRGPAGARGINASEWTFCAIANRVSGEPARGGRAEGAARSSPEAADFRGPRVSGVSGFVSAVACARPRV